MAFVFVLPVHYNSALRTTDYSGHFGISHLMTIYIDIECTGRTSPLQTGADPGGVGGVHPPSRAEFFFYMLIFSKYPHTLLQNITPPPLIHPLFIQILDPPLANIDQRSRCDWE